MATRRRIMDNRVYAWKPDVPDHRDRYFAPQAIELPPFVDRIGLGNRMENQLQIGSCTGNSATSALEIVLGIQKDKQLSRLMCYYNARLLEDPEWTKVDQGAYIRFAIKSLFKFGVCDEKTWPYLQRKVNTSPGKTAYKRGEEFLPLYATDFEYARVTSRLEVMQCIAQNIPVVFGFMVTEAFERLSKTGVLELPQQGEDYLGGHAVAAVGYDTRPERPFIWVRNSWGSRWGDKGYFRMSIDWFDDPRRLVDDMWVIRRTTPVTL